VRISKLYKSISSNKDKQTKKGSQGKDSKVGRVMSELSTKRVIIIVFLMLLIIPLFNADFWLSDQDATQAYCS
jgi:hypothetical protein